jgi:hypothetical protein
MTMKTDVNENAFSTHDLALAATISIWFPLQLLVKTNPHRAMFIFNRSKELDELVEKYWKKELRIEPRQYFDQLKSVKARLYSDE